jgi:hypothetical protein
MPASIPSRDLELALQLLTKLRELARQIQGRQTLIGETSKPLSARRTK